MKNMLMGLTAVFALSVSVPAFAGDAAKEEPKKEEKAKDEKAKDEKPAKKKKAAEKKEG